MTMVACAMGISSLVLTTYCLAGIINTAGPGRPGPSNAIDEGNETHKSRANQQRPKKSGERGGKRNSEKIGVERGRVKLLLT